MLDFYTKTLLTDEQFLSAHRHFGLFAKEKTFPLFMTGKTLVRSIKISDSYLYIFFWFWLFKSSL